MNKFSFIFCSGLLVSSCAAFAECFYLQVGGGAGFINGNITEVGINPSTGEPVINDEGTIVGSWTLGLGYLFNPAFGLEFNYVGYSPASDTLTRDTIDGSIEFEVTTDVYQLNLLGVARTPFAVGLGFYVKARAGLGYSHQLQEGTATFITPGGSYTTSGSQSDHGFTPVLGIGLERDLSRLMSLNLEYLAAISNEMENSALYLAFKFNPSLLMPYR